MKFLKNYFFIFFISYVVLIFTKFIFVFYLQDFDGFKLYDLIYAIFWGYKFDFATSGFFSLIITLFDFNKKLLVFFASILITIIFFTQISDIIYFYESSRHIGYEITDAIVDAKSLFLTAYSHHKLLTISSIIFGIMLFFLLLKIFKNLEKIKLNRVYFFKKFLLLIISVFFIRGMFQHIPLNPWQSNQIGDTKLASISLNATYNVIFSLTTKDKKLKKIDLPNIKNKIIKQSFNELYNEKENNISLPIITTKPNVVLLFLESWSLKHISPKVTPKFYKILNNSIRVNFMIASGHRTTEGIFAVLTSFQNPLGKSVAQTQLQNFHYTSLIDFFNDIGYYSAFFQGTSKETSGTGSLANSLGFKKSFGKRDIKKRIFEENYWGVHDIDLYNFVLTKLSEPFIIGINGATTHDNKIPKKIKFINFTNSDLDKELNALHFSDFALGKFIDEVEKKYPNTVFVLFADHCGGGLSGTLENYQIPFAIYSKKLIKPKFYNVILSQRDIAPTILDLVIGNYKKLAPNFSGKSLISDKIFFADYFHNGILGWIEGNKLIELNIATNKINCFKIQNLEKIKSKCIKEHFRLKNHALSFTNISQELLFSGETNKFKELKQLLLRK